MRIKQKLLELNAEQRTSRAVLNTARGDKDSSTAEGLYLSLAGLYLSLAGFQRAPRPLLRGALP